MEPISTSTKSGIPASVKQPSSTPWGVFIGLVLILGIIVSGAYYSFSKRLAPLQSPQESSKTAR